MRYKTRPQYVDAIVYNGYNWDDVLSVLHCDDDKMYKRYVGCVYIRNDEGTVSCMTKETFFKRYEHETKGE